MDQTQTTTTKRTKVIGTQQYVNTTTGEIEDFQVISIEDRDAHFEKLWIGHILEAIDEIGNAKMQILMYLISNRNRENLVVKTQDEISKDTGISRMTVNKTIKILMKHDIIRTKTGVIYINPNVIYRGGRNARLNVLFRYEKCRNGSEGDEDTCR